MTLVRNLDACSCDVCGSQGSQVDECIDCNLRETRNRRRKFSFRNALFEVLAELLKAGPGTEKIQT